MKLLIIGSKGFIGSHSIRHFRALGFEVFGCDVVVEYNDPNYFQVDATNASYDEIFSSHDFEACINCAGAASVPDSFVHPGRDFHLNVHTVYSILEAIRKNTPSCKFINLSSAAVYGNPAELPVAESSDTKPLSPYGCHKLYAELICDEFYRYYGIPTCSVRIFSAYGPGLQKQLFWDWYQKVKQATSITLFGTGKESRDFVFIDDVVQAVYCVLQHSSFKGDIVNVGNGKEVFIERAIEVFQEKSRMEFRYTFNNQVRTGDPLNWAANIAKLSSFGYKPKVGFEDGINQYIQWLEEKK